MDDVESAQVLGWVSGVTKINGDPLTIGSRNNRISAVASFYKRAMQRRWATWSPTGGLQQSDEREPHEKREAFKMPEMQKLFTPQLVVEATRVWQGMIYPSRLWVLLLMISAGMRVREAAQLAVEDVVDVDGIWCARVTADIDEQGRRGRRRAKNRASRRLVPLHLELERHGFLEYVKQRRAEVEDETEPLFPDCTDAAGIKALSNWGGRFMRKLKLSRPKLSVYSLRHNFTTQMRDAGVSEDVQRQFIGHKAGSDAHVGYVKPREIKALAALVWPALDEWLPEVLANLR